MKAGIELEEAGAGGLLGLRTALDPYLTKSDSLVGNVVGKPGKLPKVRENLSLKTTMLKRLVEAKEFSDAKSVKIGENLLLNSGTARTIGEVMSMKKENIEAKLKIPIAADDGDRVVISRMIGGRWRLVGYGIIS
jgi:translation initiation factor 2 subunit 3